MRRAAAAAGLAAALVCCAPAAAQSPGSASPPTLGAPTAATSAAATDPNALQRPESLDVAPPGRLRTGREVQAVAARDPRIAAERSRFPGSYANVFMKGAGRWQVSFYSRSRPAKEIAQAYVSDATGRVIEAWTGPQVAWTMARGYPGAFGRKVNSPWVWLPLTALFVVPFVDPRRPWRARHLDLLALAGFGVSVAFFNDANLDASVPIVPVLLAYLLARMLWIGLRRGARPPPLRTLVPVSWLLVGLIFLIGFRIGLNVTDSNVIDVGYAGVIGADRLADGDRLWGAFPQGNPHGDTYGPVAYAAYVPFEQLLPWNGTWTELHAARAAAIAFDLACLALLFLLGRFIRGPSVGVVLAYAWAAYPFTLYAMNTNVNDGLVAALVLAALASAASPAGRGALLAAAGAAKFAPLALAPLLATHGGRRGPLRFALGFGAVGALALALVLGYGGLGAFWDRTVAFQTGRDAPFSVWGLHGWETAQAAVQAAAALLAVAVAFVPRRRDLAGLCALAAAVLIAVQLALTYWSYAYLVWFAGPLLVAVLADQGRWRGSMPSADIGDEQRMSTPMSHGSSSEVSNRTDIWVRSDSIA